MATLRIVKDKFKHQGRFQGNLSIKHIERNRMSYFIGWIVILICLYSCLFIERSSMFLGGEFLKNYSQIYTYICLIACPTIAVIFKGEQYVPKTIYSILMLIISIIIIMVFRNSVLNLIFNVVGAIAVGHVFASCGYGFFMILNNSEKLYSMILGIVIPKGILVISTLFNSIEQGKETSRIIMILCTIVLLICSIDFRRKKSHIPKLKEIEISKKAYSLMAVIFVTLALNDVIAPFILSYIKDEIQKPLEILYFTGMVLGVATIIIFQKYWKFNICIVIGLSFAFLIVGFSNSLIATKYAYGAYMTALFFGGAYSIGIIDMYYIAGLMAKKFRSITFYRRGIVLSSSYYFVSFVIIYLLKESQVIIALASIFIIVLFFVVAPVFNKTLYEGEWIDDSYREDVTFESRLEARLRELRLSNKEIQVCQLLLKGHTLRQTSAMIGIAYSTVNTYCTSLYRKLDINSRAELMLLFKQYIDK